MKTNADVVVAGAGVIGLAVARELGRRGLSVIVVDPDAPARQASWAAAGMLSPLGEAASRTDLHELAEASLDRWPDFAASLHRETGVDIEYRTGGALHVAFDEKQSNELRAMHARANATAGARFLDRAEAIALEPALAPDLHSALFIERDHRVNNRRLGQALWAAASRAGVHFRFGLRVEEIAAGAVRDSSPLLDVRLERSEMLTAGAIVLAAGAWSGMIRGLSAPLPVRPVRGQMFSVLSGGNAPLIGRSIVGPGCYLVPREDGQVLVGATVEDVGFSPGPTPAGLLELMAAATRVLPDLAHLPVRETWSGFRPGTPDHLPILGEDPVMKRVFHASGHFRNGILLTPITAELIAAVVRDRTPAVPLKPFSPARFG